jgi:hypothetical protein
MSTQNTIRIKSSHVDRLRHYSLATGVPITKCVEEAVRNWLDSVADARLIYLRRKIEEEYQEHAAKAKPVKKPAK